MLDSVPFSQVVIRSLLLGVLGLLCYIVVRRLRLGRQEERLPPSPPGHWLFGNAPPASYAYRQFAHLANIYGPIFTLRYGSRRLVVITRVEPAVDIMVKQSHNLVDRPRAVAAGEVISGGMRTLILGAGDRLKKYRSVLHATLQPQSATKYEPLQMQNARNFVLDLLDEPDKFIEHAKRYAASVIMSLTYGKMTPTSYSDPEVKKINLLVERLGSAMRPGAHLVDSYPFLKYIPGLTSELQKWHREELDLFSSQIQGVKERLARNEAYPCFATTLIERQEEFGLNDDELAYLAGSMFGAGSDTTAGVLPIVIMAAARHPQMQARVQAQLDEVVGRDRLPTFADWEKLPEVAAYVQEVYRWRPVTPLGFAHRATKDVTWKGYVIPAGTEVLACHWAIARDPDVFPDPEKFKPARWLDEKGQLREDLKFFNWGFGRRICPGLHVAERSVFINTALTLWAFEISEDPAHPIDTLAIKDGALAHPYPFVVRFKPRISNLREKILAHDE
ncbi:cytochrome P450 [Trametes coccinea BRFM310]|uniref:Cytochrome P450 n=1 Tax=Trametes coccinea (strain BRFM310) TaxID=1353009 RepID=A0A1Y2I925_TRAC3|nr:cytochrome P450 [Trametes coccinea BRFM310]